MGRVSRRGPLMEGAGNLSTKSDPSGSRGRKLKGGFPKTLPSGLWSMLSTRKRGGKKSHDLLVFFPDKSFPFNTQSKKH